MPKTIREEWRAYEALMSDTPESLVCVLGITYHRGAAAMLGIVLDQLHSGAGTAEITRMCDEVLAGLRIKSYETSLAIQDQLEKLEAVRQTPPTQAH